MRVKFREGKKNANNKEAVRITDMTGSREKAGQIRMTEASEHATVTAMREAEA
jgi:hypothetical protein